MILDFMGNGTFSHQDLRVIMKYNDRRESNSLRITERVKRLTAGERIRLLRMDRGYTREQLAERAEISEKFLYEIETGRKGFSAVTLLNLSKALEVSLDYIMIGKGSRKYDDEIVATLELFKPNSLEMVNRLLKVAYEISRDGK